MENTARIIKIDNTRFFSTNFSGNPANDRFGDARRKANIIIPDPAQAEELIRQGFNVRHTNPRPDDDPNTFVPTYFVQAILKYRDRDGHPMKYPPKVVLVNDRYEEIPYDEEMVGQLDRIRVKNVRVILNPRVYDEANGSKNLYIRTIYIEQDLESDCYADYYRRKREELARMSDE